MKCKIIGDISFGYDIILRFCGIYSFGFPNETPVTLVIDIFKLSTSRHISLSRCTFGQTWARSILTLVPILGTSLLGSQIKNEESTYKKASGSLMLKLYHFKPILSWETSIEQRLMPWSS